jgi:hypothetical protein
MSQIAANVKMGQFSEAPTFLVVPMIRTAVRQRGEELTRTRYDAHLGGRVTGHLWAIAAAPLGEHFHDATRHSPAADLGPLSRAGIFVDFPFVAGMIFIHTEWNELGNADFALPFPDRAFRTFGIWNDNYEPINQDSLRVLGPRESAFHRLCDQWRLGTNQSYLFPIGEARGTNAASLDSSES